MKVPSGKSLSLALQNLNSACDSSRSSEVTIATEAFIAELDLFPSATEELNRRAHLVSHVCDKHRLLDELTKAIRSHPWFLEEPKGSKRKLQPYFRLKRRLDAHTHQSAEPLPFTLLAEIDELLPMSSQIAEHDELTGPALSNFRAVIKKLRLVQDQAATLAVDGCRFLFSVREEKFSPLEDKTCEATLSHSARIVRELLDAARRMTEFCRMESVIVSGQAEQSEPTTADDAFLGIECRDRVFHIHGRQLNLSGSDLRYKTLVAVIEAGEAGLPHKELFAKLWPNDPFARRKLDPHISKFNSEKLNDYHLLIESKNGALVLTRLAGVASP